MTIETLGFARSRSVTATVSIPPSKGVRIGWWLFWRSLWWTIRGHRSISFDLEDDAP